LAYDRIQLQAVFVMMMKLLILLCHGGCCMHSVG